ncbi:MAG: replication initiation protein, partial [Vibrionaceae bacterium]
SHVVVEFSSRIEPYLFELKDRFTAVNFEYAARLNTPFSFRLYQWLIKAKKLHKHQQGEAVVVELTVEWMKSQAGLSGDYERWGHFSERVIKPAVEKINQHTDISVIWQPIRTAKKITAVRFIYSPEAATQAKPLRPRLHRRPKTEKGSYQEGAWLRNNKKLLLDYEQALKQYDPKAKLDIADLRRLVAIYESLGECSEIHADYQQRLQELKERRKNS